MGSRLQSIEGRVVDGLEVRGHDRRRQIVDELEAPIDEGRVVDGLEVRGHNRRRQIVDGLEAPIDEGRVVDGLEATIDALYALTLSMG